MSPTAHQILKTMRSGGCENMSTLRQKHPKRGASTLVRALGWLHDQKMISPIRARGGEVSCFPHLQFYAIAARGELELRALAHVSRPIVEVA